MAYVTLYYAISLYIVSTNIPSVYFASRSVKCISCLHGYAAMLVNIAHDDQFINMVKEKIKVYSNLKVNVSEVILVVNYESNGFQT